MRIGFLLFLFFSTLSAEQVLTDYAEAMKQVERQKLPVAIAFVKENEPLSAQFIKETLSSEAFLNVLNHKMIIAIVDVSSEKNHKVQKKYGIIGTPVVVLLDDDLEFIALSGYKSENPQIFAQELLSTFAEYKQYELKRKSALAGQVSGKELKRLYQKSNELFHKEDAIAFIEAGINSDQSLYFLTEKYRNIVKNGKRKSPEALDLRKKLVTQDPNNEHLTHYHIALIDYEDNCNDDQCRERLAPLVSYLEHFGSSNHKYHWQLNLIVAQTELNNKNFAQALHYAKQAKTLAPSDQKQAIQEFVDSIASSR
ncbi:MAG: hypothetical protein WD595_06090 [Waddliaceae bacterium]